MVRFPTVIGSPMEVTIRPEGYFNNPSGTFTVLFSYIAEKSFVLIY